jgi:hypothetical protein
MTLPPKSHDRTPSAITKRADLPQLETVAKQELDDNPQLESIAEAEQQNQVRIEHLVDRLPETAIALEASNTTALCGLIICALSSRRFRRAFMRKLYKLHKEQPGPQEYATIYLETIPEGACGHAGS